MAWHHLIKLAPNLFQVIEGKFVSFFILQGKNKTVLIDCGYGISDTYQEFNSLFIGEVIVVNTHIHPDHSNANAYFPHTMMHRIEWEKHALNWNANLYKINERKWNPALQLKIIDKHKLLPKSFSEKQYNQWVSKGIPKASLLENGDRIAIDNFDLEIIFTPAHTEGSISILDHKNGYLFVGDAFCKDLKWLLNLKCRADLKSIFSTYKTFEKRAKEVAFVLPSHGEVMIAPNILTTINQKMEQIQRKVLTPKYFTKRYVEAGYYFDFGGFGPVFAPEVLD